MKSKEIPVRIFIFTLALVLTPVAHAAVNTCSELESAYKADLITEISSPCKSGTCRETQLLQLRATAVEKSGLDAKEVAKMTDTELEDQFEPIYTVLYVGNEAYEGVNVSLGDNPFVSYFAAGTTKLSKISSDDGSVSVAGEYCDVELAPYFSPVRREIMCKAVVAEVLAQKPTSKVDLAACLDEREADFYLETDAGPDVLGLTTSRNTATLGGGYYSCSAEMNRKTNELSNLTCSVH